MGCEAKGWWRGRKSKTRFDTNLTLGGSTTSTTTMATTMATTMMKMATSARWSRRRGRWGIRSTLSEVNIGRKSNLRMGFCEIMRNIIIIMAKRGNISFLRNKEIFKFIGSEEIWFIVDGERKYSYSIRSP